MQKSPFSAAHLSHNTEPQEWQDIKYCASSALQQLEHIILPISYPLLIVFIGYND